jgi:hypothetical protein
MLVHRQHGCLNFGRVARKEARGQKLAAQQRNSTGKPAIFAREAWQGALRGEDVVRVPKDDEQEAFQRDGCEFGCERGEQAGA